MRLRGFPLWSASITKMASASCPGATCAPSTCMAGARWPCRAADLGREIRLLLSALRKLGIDPGNSDRLRLGHQSRLTILFDRGALERQLFEELDRRGLGFVVWSNRKQP